MKIAFLTTRMEKPSARYRFFQYMPYLEKEGYSIEVSVVARNFFKRKDFFENLRRFDIVFLQKRVFGIIDWHFLRKNAKRIVYDFDDAVMFGDSKKKSPESFSRMARFKRTVKGADAVVAGNGYLKEWALRFNKNVFEIPTSIDMDRYEEKKDRDNNGVITIGWIGSSSTLLYLEGLKDVLDEIHVIFPNTRLKIVSNRFFDCAKMPVEKKLWNYDEEISDLHSFDVGLMPLTDDPWTRGKCGFKLLQYMAVGLPAVASPVGVNKEIVTDGVNGSLAGDKKEWIEKLSKLIGDGPLRMRLGSKARTTVMERYSVEANAGKLKSVLEDVIKI